MISTESLMMQDGFTECLGASLGNQDLVAQFDRLLECRIGESITSERMPDPDEFNKFVAFVDEFVYQPMAAKFLEAQS